MSMVNNPPTAKSKAERDLDRAVDAVQKEAESAKDQFTEAGSRMHQAASDAIDKTKDVVAQQAEEGKGAVAASMGDFAAAVKRASDELGERDQSMAASLVRQVAGGLEDASRSLRGSSVSDLTRSVSDFARRQPAAFLLGATVAGIALGRFVKATDERPHDDSVPPVASGYGRSSTAGPTHHDPYAASTANTPSSTRTATQPSAATTSRPLSGATTQPASSTIPSSRGGSK